MEVAASGQLYVEEQLSQEGINFSWEEIALVGNWLWQVYFSTRFHHAASSPSL